MRGGLIGCGYISRAQLEAWARIDSAEIAAVCDLDREKAERRAREFGVDRVYDDPGRMLAEGGLDFVDIATRPSSHLELARAAAAAGLPVLCQKPLADTLEEARRIVAVCKEAGVMLMVNENGRQQAWFRKMRALIEAGRLGEIFNARFESRWRSTLPEPDFEGQDYFTEMPRLFVFEMGVHYLDTARYLFGEADSVYARLQRVSPHIAGEDMAVLLVNFGDLACLIDGNFYSFPEPRPMVTWGPVRVEGTHGTLVLQGDGSLVLYSQAGTETWPFPATTIPDSFVAAQRHFIDSIRSGREPETSGEETLKTMALVFAAYLSGETGQAVNLPGPELV